jgi:hypothetical protein
VTDLATRPLAPATIAPARRRRTRRLWASTSLVLRIAARRFMSRYGETARAFRHRHELIDMLALDDASLRALGVARAEIVAAVGAGWRTRPPAHLVSAIEGRRRDLVAAAGARKAAGIPVIAFDARNWRGS